MDIAVSATVTVVMIAKNEGPYLVEWLAYHRVLGFDEIVIYENNSTDDSDTILRKLAGAGKVTHRKWTLGRNESPQITAYQDALRKVKTDWILFIDADEFLVLQNETSVKAFLAPLDARKEVSAIGVNWRIFGSAGLLTNDGRPVMERFTLAAEPDFVVNTHLKSFSRVASLSGMVHMHACATKGKMVHPSGEPLTMLNWGLSEKVELDVAQINHYYTKTPEEYELKKARGQGGAGDNKPELKFWYNDESFVGHNRNDVKDVKILERYEEVKAEVARLNSILTA
ncbi:glycosyltransferase family 2 protein [Asticcacaulis machinosus]|uniref:Glycosyltransferase family 2 protein n=1 Tax=Asticcacaulis machinosus TaxID=2984211 RepID=A0ABT5HJV1_9CAUL|nr:glycosyltransferase family 2 protein [Asticcacaulis machinosus]MDC7676502.1 glycosyltransferase family 2 protein [Asticcacaulis machinosus]